MVPQDFIQVKAEVNKHTLSWSATETLFAVLPAYQARDQEQNPAATFVNNYKSDSNSSLLQDQRRDNSP